MEAQKLTDVKRVEVVASKPIESIEERRKKIEDQIEKIEKQVEPGVMEAEYVKTSPISNIEIVYGKGQHTEGTENHTAPMPSYTIGGYYGTQVEWPQIEIEWTFVGRRGNGGKKKVFKPAGVFPTIIVDAFNAALIRHMDAQRKNLIEHTIPYLKSKLAKLSK